MAVDWGSVGSDAGTGATLGSFAGPEGTAIGAGVGALVGLSPSLFKLINGIGQTKAANAINPVNPGYVMNQGVFDNQRILSDRYNNYTLPGYTQQSTNINNNYQNAFAAGSQGASSGGDIADLAAKLAYGKSVATGNLATAQAQGKQEALTPYLEANKEAGQQYQDQNAYNRQQYEQQLAHKAYLTNAGAQNTYSGLDNGANILTSYLNPKHTTTDFSTANNGKAKSQGSIFSTPAATPAQTYDGNGNFNWNSLYGNTDITNGG